MDPLDADTQTRGGAPTLLRAVLLVVVVPALIVIAYAAFSLHGHREDYPSQPMQTWPPGASSLALAATLAWTAIRPSRGLQPIAIVVAVVVFLASWATVLP